MLAKVVDFEVFRAPLEAALGYADGTKGGRPPYDPVAMFKILVLAAQHTASDERMEFLIRDRLSWMRFLGFELGAPTPDRNTIWTFRERLTRAGVIDALFAAFERALREAGYLPMGGQIVDATLVASPRQRLSADEKDAAKAGRSADDIWPDRPAKAAQKDVDARWTVKTGRRPPPEGAQRQLPAIAIPVFGYKNHVAIDRAYGFIRRAAVSDAAHHDGAMLRCLVTSDNLAASVWADTAYRSQASEAWLASIGRGVADPSQEAARAADAPARRVRQRPQVRRARPRGACVCPAEGAHGIARADDRPHPGADPHRSGQPGLQLSTPGLP